MRKCCIYISYKHLPSQMKKNTVTFRKYNVILNNNVIAPVSHHSVLSKGVSRVDLSCG